MPVRRAVAVVVLAGLLAGGGAATSYRVQRGDTLASIARRHGTTVDALVAANGIRDPHRIRAGATLRLAGADASRLPAKLRQSPERLALVPHFDRAARDFGVPADLLKAVTWLESGWQNDKVSSIGARGIGQLMPATVELTNRSLLGGARLDPGRPVDNIRLSARFLRYLLDRCEGDPAAALAAYYQGLRSVREQGPKPHTVVYVADVLALRARFR
ncbi:MAG TPA: transglycosylase SLT domain-containing protein [Acidimicrobiales bacterium]|nr:transglycosylase SLT domain-containing protein [Acidimicrobiales bacterium]